MTVQPSRLTCAGVMCTNEWGHIPSSYSKPPCWVVCFSRSGSLECIGLHSLCQLRTLISTSSWASYDFYHFVEIERKLRGNRERLSWQAGAGTEELSGLKMLVLVVKTWSLQTEMWIIFLLFSLGALHSTGETLFTNSVKLFIVFFAVNIHNKWLIWQTWYSNWTWFPFAGSQESRVCIINFSWIADTELL